MMRRSDHRVFQFADFRADMAERVLTRDGQAISLRPKLFELLVFFLEHQGEILEKDEIVGAVWGGLSQGSADQPLANLTVNISNLRQALGDDSEKPLFIETLPHRGYRFIALVRVVEAQQARQAETRLSAVSTAAAGGGHQAFSSVSETAATIVAPRWPEPLPDGKADVPTSTANQAESLARPEPSRAFPKLSRSVLVVVSITLLAIAALLAWVMTKPGGASQPEVVNSYGNLMGKEPANSSAGSHSTPGSRTEAIIPRIDSIEPATPPAWIGVKPIKVRGSGFHPGLSVTMTFPGGGGITLDGVAVLDVASNEFTLMADFNNNPGEYRIRINSPEGMNSDWLVFDVLPASLLPAITSVKQIGTSNGKVRIAVAGSNFLQNVSAILVYPDGEKEYLTGHRVSGELFQALFDSRGQTHPFKIQAQNAGKGSNVVSFNVPNP